jgi:hypothetical protein
MTLMIDAVEKVVREKSPNAHSSGSPALRRPTAFR